MQSHPRPNLLDRRARARLWLLALLLGALLPAVYLTADHPVLLAAVLAVWMAATVVAGAWAVHDLALPDPSSLPRPATGEDLVAVATAVGVYRIGRHALVQPSDTPTGVIPQVTA